MHTLATFILPLLAGLQAKAQSERVYKDNLFASGEVAQMVSGIFDILDRKCTVFILEMSPFNRLSTDGISQTLHGRERTVLTFTNRKDWENGVRRIDRSKCQFHILMGELDKGLLPAISYIWDQKLTRDGFTYLFLTDMENMLRMQKNEEIHDLMNIFVLPILNQTSQEVISLYTINAYGGESGTPLRQILYTWSTENKRFRSRLGLKSSMGFKDLNGWTMKCAYLDVFPYFFSNKENDGFTGVDEDIVKTIGEKMNYGLSFSVSIDGNFGVIRSDSNNSFNGMVGMAQRKEVDCALSSITKAYHRNKVIDYSIGTFTVYGAFITRKTGPVPKWRAMMDPFGFEVWIALIITIVGFSAMYHSILRLSNHEQTVSIQMSCLNIWGSLFNQSMKHPKKHSSRIVIGFWFLFSICIVTSYAGSLSSFLTLPRTKAPIDFLKDLVKSPMRILTLKNSFLELVFKNSDDETFIAAYNGFMANERNGLLCENIPDCINLVHDNPDISFIYDSDILESHLLTIPDSQNNIRIGKGYFLPSEYAIVFRKNAPFLDQFDINLLHLKETGLLKQWRIGPLNKRKSENEGKEIVEKKKDKSREYSATNESITLYHLQGAFMLYALGIGLSLIAFVRENHRT